MTFRSLAISGIRGNWRAYNAFFLSSVFSVFVFYVYGAFIYHPDVINGHIEAADKVKQGMIACQYIVVVFSFFFVMYANSAFLKTRKKEFGLYTLFGMTGSQLRRMLMVESAVLAILAIAAGMGIGILFSKLFFMAMAVLLDVDNPIRFAVPLKAVLLTAIGYFVLFNLLTWLTSIRAGRSEIVDLLKESSKPKTQPAFSVWLTVLSIFCLAAGYVLAFTMTSKTFLVTAIPTVGFVTLGSYFLFTQGSVAFLRMAQRSKTLFYNRTNLITLSQMTFKLKDNARILFMVSILSAVILTASGTFYAWQQVSEEQLLSHIPQTIGYVETGLNEHRVLPEGKVKQVLDEDGRKLVYDYKIVGIPVDRVDSGKGNGGDADRYRESIDNEPYTSFISETDYNRIAGLRDEERLNLEVGHAYVVFPYKEMKEFPPFSGQTILSEASGQSVRLTVDDYRFGAIITPIKAFTDLIVIDDEQYKQLLTATPEDRQAVNYGYEFKNWQSSLSTVQKIEGLIPADQKHSALTYRVSSYLENKQATSLTMFVGLFVSLLFFIASGSVLYFKLFTEMKEDETQFRALTRIGMTAGEIRRIVASQVGAIFYVPVAVGIVHMAFAMKALGTLLEANIWIYALIVICIYAAMQTLYFVIACTGYTKRMLNASA